MDITMIAAMDRKRTIGGPKGGIPWHLPRDSAHFRRLTRNRHVLLGRRTFEEMDGWFITQTPIVLTRDPNYRPPVGLSATSMESALSLAGDRGESNLIIAGGATIYSLALPRATKMVLTLVDTVADVSMGTRAEFPEWNQDEWFEISKEHFPGDEENEHAITIVTLVRTSP